MSFDAMSIYLKLFITAALVVVTAAVTYHFTSNSYAGEVASLRTTISALNTQLETSGQAVDAMNDSAKQLREAIVKQNRAADAAKNAAARRAAVLASELATAKANAARSQSRLVALQKVTAPIVDLTGMTPVEIKTEISTCRRAVEISNRYQDQESQ